MSIKGVARFYKGRKKHIITTQTEHKCVLDSCRAMEQEGYEVHMSEIVLDNSCALSKRYRQKYIEKSPKIRSEP